MLLLFLDNSYRCKMLPQNAEFTRMFISGLEENEYAAKERFEDIFDTLKEESIIKNASMIAILQIQLDTYAISLNIPLKMWRRVIMQLICIGKELGKSISIQEYINIMSALEEEIYNRVKAIFNRLDLDDGQNDVIRDSIGIALALGLKISGIDLSSMFGEYP